MNIGILTPSIYMYESRYKNRIFAPGDLARQLVAGLVARGHRVSWFTAPEEARGSSVVVGDTRLLDGDLALRVMQDITPQIQERVSLFGTKMYYEMDLLTRAYAAAGKIDVFHQFHSFGFLAHFFQELTGAPTVYTLHDPMPTPDMHEHWLLTRFPTHRLVSVSQSQQGAFGNHFIGTVYNGIDPAGYPVSLDPGTGLIAVGRMVKEKGIDVAIAAARGAGEKLTIASWVSDNVKRSAYYQTKVEPHVDGDRVRIADFLTGAAKAQFFQGARALVFPIGWEEPFGMVMIEAMACGTPVVAYNRGSVSEVIEDGVTGFIIDPDDTPRPGHGRWIIKKQGVEGLVEAIRRVGQIDRAACQARVQAHFTIEHMVAGYEAVYQKLLNH